MPRPDVKQGRPGWRGNYGRLICSAEAAFGADADDVLTFLDEQPGLLTGTQVRHVCAINEETNSACLSLDAFVACDYQERVSGLRLCESRCVNPVGWNRLGIGARHWRGTAGDGQNRGGAEPKQSHTSSLSTTCGVGGRKAAREYLPEIILPVADKQVRAISRSTAHTQ
jgi:hypothetical protein